MKFKVGDKVHYVGKVYKSLSDLIGEVIIVHEHGVYQYSVMFGGYKSTLTCAESELAIVFDEFECTLSNRSPAECKFVKWSDTNLDYCISEFHKDCPYKKKMKSTDTSIIAPDKTTSAIRQLRDIAESLSIPTLLPLVSQMMMKQLDILEGK